MRKYGIFGKISLPTLSLAPYRQYLSLVFPLKTGGGIEPFRTLLAVFAPAACRWGADPRQGAGRAGNGRGEKQATSSMGVKVELPD